MFLIHESKMQMMCLASILVVLRFLNMESYTSFNVLLLIIAIINQLTFQNNHIISLWPVVFVNTLAVNLTFYAHMAFLDHKFMQSMIRKYDWNVRDFILGDIIFHATPSVLMILHVIHYPGEWKRLILNACPFYPLYSITINLVWGLVYGDNFDLSKIYVYASKRTWLYSWLMNIILHGWSALFLEYLAGRSVQPKYNPK